MLNQLSMILDLIVDTASNGQPLELDEEETKVLAYFIMRNR